jgi:hypothetical protein
MEKKEGSYGRGLGLLISLMLEVDTLAFQTCLVIDLITVGNLYSARGQQITEYSQSIMMKVDRIHSSKTDRSGFIVTFHINI